MSAFERFLPIEVFSLGRYPPYEDVYHSELPFLEVFCLVEGYSERYLHRGVCFKGASILERYYTRGFLVRGVSDLLWCLLHKTGVHF